jgi:prophage tail gpP-like protein
VSDLVHSITPQFVVGGTPVPILSFDVTLGTYGSVGHANLVTSRTLLDSQGVDLVELSAQAPSSLEVGLTVSIDGTSTKIFGGEYVSARWLYDRDQITIHCRDWAGLLVDQKRVLSTIARQTAAALAPGQSPSSGGISNQNQTLSEIVTAIANQFGMTPVLHITDSNNPTVGSILGSGDQIFMPTPKSLWGILNRLARETGYEVHTTPQRELVFGTPGVGTTPITLSWNIPSPPDGIYPCRNLSIEHNPRRNLSFRVLVLSYDPGKAQTTRGEAYVMGTNTTVNGTTQVKAGAWSGSDASAITNSLEEPSSVLGGNLQIPLYTIRIDGLTQAQAQQRATAIAADIAKRELIISATIDMLPTVVPLQQVTITGDVEQEFSGHQYYVNAATHKYALPGPGRGEGTVETTITALDIQVEGVGDSVTTGGASA